MVLPKIIAERSPIANSQLLRPVAFLRTYCALRVVDRGLPLIGLTDHVEARRGWGVPNLPELDFNAKELNGAVGYPVQPIDSGAMLLAEFCGDPHHRLGMQARGISQELPEMLVVRLLDLVLNNNPAVF